MIHRSLLILILSLTYLLTAQERKKYNVHTIAFYNLENLFHFTDDPFTYDDDWTPDGKNNWTEKVYHSKVKNMAKVISEIGEDLTGSPPTIIGVCEIENRKVLEDIVNQESLLMYDYGIIQFDSPDRRGIDVALLYRKSNFIPSNYTAHELFLSEENDPNKRVYTRDQLLVSGFLDGEKIHVLVNHWPSRRGGEARSRPKRMNAARLNKKLIDSLFSLDPYSKIVSIGDLNDDPMSPSIKKVLKTKTNRDSLHIKELYNPMEKLSKKGLGSLAWRDSWSLFDQIIVSSEVMKKEYSSYRFYKAGIYNKPYLANSRGKFKGYPFRSHDNGSFTGGYSDHFPVFIYLIKEKTPNGR